MEQSTTRSKADCEGGEGIAPDIRVAFVLSPSFTLLAFAGFMDILRLAADEGDRSRQVHGRWTILGATLDPVRASCGAKILPWRTYDDPVEYDYVVVVGGLTSAFRDHSPETFDFLRLAGERDVPVVGLCTGSFAMAEVGLLRGKRCAVHCRHREEFLSRYPEVAAVTDELFVIDGQAITCAGGTAAIDVAAEVIARHCGASRALKGLPELLVDEHRTTRHGLRFPYQNLLRCGDSRVERAVKLMLGQLSQPTSMRRLADRLATSLSQLNRAFAKHCRMPPARLWREMRLLHARQLLLNTDDTLAEIAAECGFVDAAHLSRHFRGAFGEAPRAFQRARAVDVSALSVTKQERPAARVG